MGRPAAAVAAVVLAFNASCGDIGLAELCFLPFALAAKCLDGAPGAGDAAQPGPIVGACAPWDAVHPLLFRSCEPGRAELLFQVIGEVDPGEAAAQAAAHELKGAGFTVTVEGATLRAERGRDRVDCRGGPAPAPARGYVVADCRWR